MNNNDQTVNSNTVLNRHLLMYSLVIAFVAGLTAFDGALATGAIPLPHAWVWITPILATMATSLTLTLPKVVDTLPPATSQASVESVARYQQPTVATLAPAVPTPADVTPEPAKPAPTTPTEHVVTLRVAPTDAPTAKVIDVAPAPSSSPEPPAPADRPASPPSA